MSRWISHDTVRSVTNLRPCDGRLIPCLVELGAPSYAQVILTTGRNQISYATLKFSSHAGIKFKFSNASPVDESEPIFSLWNQLLLICDNIEFSLVTAEDRLTIMNVPERTSVTFFLPHSDTSAYTAIVSMNTTPRRILFGSYPILRK